MQKKKAAFLYGPSGCGKTILVKALAKKHNLELIEVNASDYRTKEQIEEKVGNATRAVLTASKKHNKDPRSVAVEIAQARVKKAQ